MICGRTRNLIDAYLDDELTGREMLAVREHLRGCPTCRQVQSEAEYTRRVLRALPAVEPGREVMAVLQGIRRPANPARPGFFNLRAPINWDRVAIPAVAGALALTALLLGLTRAQPQVPDAVVARVPHLLSVEEPAPVPGREEWILAPAGEPVWRQPRLPRSQPINYWNERNWLSPVK